MGEGRRGVLPEFSGDTEYQLHTARADLGDDFEPVPLGMIEAPDPELDRAVVELRRIRDCIAGLALSGVELADVTEALRSVADTLEERVPDAPTRLEQMWAGPGSRRANPVSGDENPIAPPLRAYGHCDGSVVGVLNLGPAYQGPPGCVHGGVSALVIDHLMGFANHWNDRLGMTAHYEIDYRSPTPLLTDLVFRSWVEKVEGRKTWTIATVHAGDRLCVEARGLFLEASVPVPGRPGSASTVGDGVA